MTNTILIKRSAIANSVPASGNLQSGELAINYTDGNLFYKDNNGNVNVIASNQFVSVSGNITGNNISVTGNVTSNNASVTTNLQVGNVNYTNTDGTDGQVLATDGNGQTYFQSLSSTGGIYLRIYVRSGGYVNVANYQGYISIVGRTGNIAVAITP